MQQISATFDAAALGAKYTTLDRLPPSLYEATLACSTGDLLGRVEAVLVWRDALLAGALPTPQPTTWPPTELSQLFSDLLASTKLLQFMKGEEEIVDAVLLDMLRLVDRVDGWRAELFQEVFRALLDVEKQRLARLAEERRKGSARGRSPVEEVDLQQLRRTADEQARQRVRHGIQQAFQNTWGPRTATWLAVEEMFGPLSNLLGLGWDLSRSILRSTGWLAAEKLRALLARLPELKAVIEALGRMAAPTNPTGKSTLEEIIGPLIRPVEVMVPALSPDVPVEMRGVERSGDIGRMLPSEAAMLTHPVLRMMWHARRAERSLLTYEAQGIDFRIALVERESEGPGKRERPADQRGPMILCVDTSGSMSGAPETVAKAIALEALRTAHTERRRLFVYLFSGPGDVVERELSVSKQGIADFLTFLSDSFHGGTDVAAPLRRALERIEHDGWKEADVLLVSDGEFPLDDELRTDVSHAKERHGVRVSGLLVGAERSAAMAAVCEPLHRFLDWRALLGATAG